MPDFIDFPWKALPFLSIGWQGLVGGEQEEGREEELWLVCKIKNKKETSSERNECK